MRKPANASGDARGDCRHSRRRQVIRADLRPVRRWVPSFVFPEWLQSLSLFVPTRWAIDGLALMTWRGLGFEAALMPMGVLIAFSAAMFALAIWRFRWDE